MQEKHIRILNSIAVTILAIVLSAINVFMAYRLIARIVDPDKFQSLSFNAGATLLSSYLGLQVVFVVIIAGVYFLSRFLNTKLSGNKGPLVAGGLTGLLGLPLFYWVGHSLAQGEWIASQSYAKFIGPVAGIIGAISLFVFVWIVTLLCLKILIKRFVRLIIAMSAGVVSWVFIGVDQIVLPMLYPEFHTLLFVIAAAFSAVFGIELAGVLVEKVSVKVKGGILLLSVLTVLMAVYFILNIDRKSRSELAQSTPMASGVVNAISRSEPRNNLERLLRNLPKGKEDLSGEMISGIFTDPDSKWNVVLIVIDAMRIDAAMPAYAPKWNQLSEKDIPFMSKWRKKTIRFPYAYSGSNSTRTSMPSMMRSILPSENLIVDGVPVAKYMSSLGRLPVAVVVNNLFSKPSSQSFVEIYDGFENVEVYHQNQMHKQNQIITRTLKEVQDQPFFAWVHLYGLHAPGFSGKKMLSKDDGSYVETYQMSVRWMDSQLEELFGKFEDMGLMDNTVFVIASDHAEGLGIRGMETHGKFLTEEEVRVPLMFKIPGHDGALIENTVGNIDIIPTVADLIGETPSPLHRGKSLVPLMIRPNSDWSRYYYVQDSKKKYSAVVSGREKLIYQPSENMFFRYDLKADPLEKDDLFGEDPAADTIGIQKLAIFDQKLFDQELEDEKTAKLLEKRLGEISESTPKDHLQLLFGLAARSDSPKVMEIVTKKFDTISSQDVRLSILKNMFIKDRKLFGKRMVAYLETLAGSPEELSFVEGLAGQGQPKFEEAKVAKRMLWWIENSDVFDQVSWLSMIKSWRKISGRSFKKPLLLLLLKLPEIESSEQKYSLVQSTLNGISMLQGLSLKDRADFSKQVVTYVKSDKVAVSVAALKALAKLKTKDGLTVAMQFLSDTSKDTRIRKEAMNVVVGVKKQASVTLLLKYGKEEPLLLDVIAHLKKIRSKKALPFLNKLSKDHFRGYVRVKASKAARHIRK